MSQRTYKVLIADDEPGAIDLLKALLLEHASFQIVATTQDAQEAVEFIKSGRIDVAFLDIEFPETTVFDLLNAPPEHIQLVFVSAHAQHAIKAIKHRALDYLLKPVDPDEFEKVLHRIEAKDQATNKLPDKSIEELQRQRIALPTQHGYQYIAVSDISSITAQRSYAELHDIHNRRILVSRNLADFERILACKGFIRIHRSHLVNSEHIASFSRIDGGCVEMHTGQTFLLSRTYKDSALEKITALIEKI